jgi:uncharacterized protein
MLLDAHDSAVPHVHDGGPAAEEIRAPALQRPLVGRVELDAREAHADDDTIRQADRALDHDVVALGGAIRDHLEDTLTADDDRVRGARRDPLHVGIEHRFDRLEVTVDESVVAAKEKLGALVGHQTESRRPTAWSRLVRPRAHSSAGRASRWQREGRRFEPGWVHSLVGAEPEEWRTPSRQLLRLRRYEVLVAVSVAVIALTVVGAISGSGVTFGAAAAVLVAGVLLWRFVSRRFGSWGYAERDDDLLVRRGVMFARLSVVPYGRMQFIDVTAGPLERAFGLATVRLHTAAAATDARIPGLEREEAARLRDRLAELGEAQAAGL